MSNRFAERVGLYGGIVAIVLGSIQVWQYLRPKERLEGVVHYGAFRAPPAPTRSLIKASDVSDALSLAGYRSNDTLAAPLFAGRLEEIVRARFEAEGLSRGYSKPRTHAEVTIGNVGSRALEAVQLQVPRVDYACVAKPRKEPECGNTADLFNIGVLQPRESATLQLWLADDLAPYYYDRFTLSHSGGIGDLDFYTPVPPPWGTLQQYAFVWMLFGGVAMFSGLLWLMGWVDRQARKSVTDWYEARLHHGGSGEAQPAGVSIPVAILEAGSPTPETERPQPVAE